MTESTDGLQNMKLFDEKRGPIVDQILDLMEYLEYPKDAIEKARKELKDKKNMRYALNLAQTLAMQFIGQSIFEAVSGQNGESVNE